MRKDRSGISTVLIAIVVIVVVVVAAAAAYVVLSGNDNDDGEKEAIAPGTVLEYDMSLFGVVVFATYKVDIVGQNADEYFIKVTQTFVEGGLEYSAYTVDSKGIPDGATRTGTTQLDTIHGSKTVNIWEQTEDGETVKSYVDPSNQMLMYKQEGMAEGLPITLDLTKYEPVWQTSYEESEAIGTVYEYTTIVGGHSYDRDMVCVADITGGKYGMSFDVSNLRDTDDVGKLCYISNYPEGLPADAVKVGGIITIGAANYGNVQVEKWSMSVTNESGITIGASFYCDPVTHTVYRAVFDESGTPITFELK